MSLVLVLVVAALVGASHVQAAGRPHIVFFLQDDQDVFLGGLEPMPQTRELLMNQGMTIDRAYIHTPVCCPSRAETLTGRFFHNVRVDTNPITGPHPTHKGPWCWDGRCGCGTSGCMCVDENKVNNRTFAVPLAKEGYKVGMFGKYLNNCPAQIQPGFSKWFANGGSSYTDCQFFDPTSPGGVYNCTPHEYAGYQTSVIGNKTVEWLEEMLPTGSPLFTYIGCKAPHMPSTPAPWYKDHFSEPGLDRFFKLPNYNQSCPDHHWVVAQQPPINSDQAAEIDNLFRDRWRTLLSVDDLIAAVVDTFAKHNQLDNTYFFLTGDHGYNLGNMRLAANKLHAYEQTLKIPMVVKGPGIKGGAMGEFFVSNADLAPTFLGLAGLSDPSMDGESFVSNIVTEDLDTSRVPASVKRHIAAYRVANGDAARRTFHWAEYNSLGNLTVFDHLIDDATSHTWRGLRFNGDPTMGNSLFAQYTALADWDYKNASEYKFYEFFDLDKDPYELHNIYDSLPADTKTRLLAMAESMFTCAGPTCRAPKSLLP